MAVIGSREHGCVHPKLRKSNSKDEACKKLLEQQACKHFKGVSALRRKVEGCAVWDIEDLASLSKQSGTQGGCAYFAARAMAQDAELVLCPCVTCARARTQKNPCTRARVQHILAHPHRYNYILDRVVRASMGIDLRGAVVIIDEAHNVEDVSCEIASLDVSTKSLLDAAELLRLAAGKIRLRETVAPIQQLLAALISWLRERVAACTKSLPTVLEGHHLLDTLRGLGLSKQTAGSLKPEIFTAASIPLWKNIRM